MEIKSVCKIKNLKKEYKGFTLRVDELEIPMGYTTVIVGENGAGKTTLLKRVAGICLDQEEKITYFDGEKIGQVKNRIGYTGTKNYYFPHWTIEQIKTLSEEMFDDFDGKKFDYYCSQWNIGNNDRKKPVVTFSDGNYTQLTLAGAFSRNCDFLVLDEPSSPLDPLMRDTLNDEIRDYIDKGNGYKSILLSTHNIKDMDNVCDYVILMHDGYIVEKGFSEDLKDKYLIVQGEKEDFHKAKDYLLMCRQNQFAFEGMALSEHRDRLLDLDLSRPDLSTILVNLMKAER